jgi:hypothetical protein
MNALDLQQNITDRHILVFIDFLLITLLGELFKTSPLPEI